MQKERLSNYLTDYLNAGFLTDVERMEDSSKFDGGRDGGLESMHGGNMREGLQEKRKYLVIICTAACRLKNLTRFFYMQRFFSS